MKQTKETDWPLYFIHIRSELWKYFSKEQVQEEYLWSVLSSRGQVEVLASCWHREDGMFLQFPHYISHLGEEAYALFFFSWLTSLPTSSAGSCDLFASQVSVVCMGVYSVCSSSWKLSVRVAAQLEWWATVGNYSALVQETFPRLT